MQSEDLIDLMLIDANDAIKSNQAFTFMENGSFLTGDGFGDEAVSAGDPGVLPEPDWTGVVWYGWSEGVTTIYASTDVDADAEMQIDLTGTYLLTENDFIL